MEKNKSDNSLWTVYFLLLFLTFNNQILAQEASFKESEVHFQNGIAELRGTLITPEGSGPYPTVIFLHGSGPMTRTGFRPYAQRFAELGIASLFYDKRGAGSSTGELQNPFRELADDAKAAIGYLKSQAEIDSTQIGFWGISQAGWIAPIAAAETGDIAFMIIISGGGASPYESEISSWENEFDKAGLSASQKEDAMNVIYSYYHYLKTGNTYTEHMARIDSIRAGTWKTLSSLPDEQLHTFADQLERILPPPNQRHNFLMLASYDPIEHIQQLTCPVLLLMGDKDTHHPADIAIKDWQEGLKKAGNNQLTLMLFPNAGHGIRMRGYNGEGRAPFADGYWEVQLGWLWLHVIQNRKK